VSPVVHGVVDEAAGNIPTTPFQLTVSGSATFISDQGVCFVANGQPLTNVGAT